MAKSRNQKGKLLYLAEIFHRETDETHGLTLAELTERLAAYGVQAERKTLYADMEELRRCGLDIDSWKEGREYRYRLASREFELPELKLLVDAVQASRFITSHQKAGVAGQRPRRPAAAAAGAHRRAGQDHEREYLL